MLALFVGGIRRAPVAQSAAQSICNRQVGGFESPLGLSPNPKERDEDGAAAGLPPWIGNVAMLDL